MKRVASPNFNDRAASCGVDYVVLHYTGMRSAQEALARLCDPVAQVSAHYLIDEDGAITQLVDEDRRAWHAGQSFWRGATDLNSLSIGIELVNPGHEFGYRAFPDVQIGALVGLLREIYARHPALRAQSLLAHSDIAPERKTDPGELFPWAQLAVQGFGLWPESATETGVLPQEEIMRLLRGIGYGIDVARPESLQAAQTAFLRRYHPERLGTGFDAESCARLGEISRLCG